MVTVRLKDIVDGMESQTDEMTAYLHRPTGRVVVVSDEAFAAADEGDEEWVATEELSEAQSIRAHDEDYVALPDRFEIDEYRMMDRFALSVENVDQQEELLRGLRGAGAFRRFKDGVHRLGLADQWYSFRDRRYEEVAKAWCEAHGIPIDARGDA